MKIKSIYFHNLLSHSGLQAAAAYNMKIIGLYIRWLHPPKKWTVALPVSLKFDLVINWAFQQYRRIAQDFEGLTRFTQIHFTLYVLSEACKVGLGPLTVLAEVFDDDNAASVTALETDSV